MRPVFTNCGDDDGDDDDDDDGDDGDCIVLLPLAGEDWGKFLQIVGAAAEKNLRWQTGVDLTRFMQVAVRFTHE